MALIKFQREKMQIRYTVAEGKTANVQILQATTFTFVFFLIVIPIFIKFVVKIKIKILKFQIVVT